MCNIVSIVLVIKSAHYIQYIDVNKTISNEFNKTKTNNYLLLRIVIVSKSTH